MCNIVSRKIVCAIRLKQAIGSKNISSRTQTSGNLCRGVEAEKSVRSNGLISRCSNGKFLVSPVCTEEFSALFVPDNGADLHSVVTVAIRADNSAEIDSVLTSLCPASNDLFRRDIMSFMAASTKGVYFIG